MTTEEMLISMLDTQKLILNEISTLKQGQQEMREEMKKSENMILSELDRVQEYLESQISQVRDNVQEIKQYYRITKLENDNTTILLKMVDDLSKRVTDLEKKTA